MKRIGITGGIGSGKSAVSAWLKEHGFKVYDTDSEARRLMNESEELRNSLKSLFGEEVYDEKGLNRKVLADKIFGNEVARNAVNRLVHPAVVSDFMSWSYSQEAEIVFVESAIIGECQLKDIVDGVLYVNADQEVRIQRAMQRDNAEREAVEKRVSSQVLSPQDATWIIDNSGSLDELSESMEKLAVGQGWISKEEVQTKKKKSKKKGKRTFWKVVLWLWLATIVWTLLLRWVPVYYTPLMLRRAVSGVFEGKEVRFERKWVPLEEVSSKYVTACIASEDNLFAKHYGFSEKGIKAAIKHNREGGKNIHGGSTISQQTAKNVFTFGTRTWFRKGVETYFTVLIEVLWGKERIMEVYCNIAELGDGIYGVEAASQHYFHKSAKKLNAQQAALLAAALPSPRRYSVTNPGPYMRKRQGQIMWLMPKMSKFPPKK